MLAVWNPEANALFLQVLEQPPAEREAFLEAACGTDASLAEQVRSLLAASEQAGSFLETPPTVVKTIADTNKYTTTPKPDLAFLAPAERPDSLGRLHHYEVLEIIGSGGFGLVLKAFDEQLHRIVAIKALKPALCVSPAAQTQFIGEARAAAKVSHQNVVDIYSVQEAGPVPYLVMKYVDGVSLEERLKTSGMVELAEILSIGSQIAAGLAAAHEQGLVHRDVKPANILLEAGTLRVKITDFGLARTVSDVECSDAGVIAGTPPYMSPEQASSKPVDFRSDLFSLGTVLYAMCAGRLPFGGNSSLEVLRAVCDESPEPVQSWNTDVPAWFAEIIGRLHAKAPSERYQSAAEVADLLGELLDELQQSRGAKVAPRRHLQHLRREPALAWARGWSLVGITITFLLTLGLTEAMGVTRLAATIVRIFTPDGTLVVEVNDPAVKVTIEGDGGLVVTGAGFEEIRLRPGSYRVRAVKGKEPLPLEREFVRISEGDREVVRIKVEEPPAIGSRVVERDAFVLWSDDKDKVFGTLAEAVLAATGDETLEIRGNGPFVTDPVHIRHPLVIRAAAGFRPVIRGSPLAESLRIPLLKSDANLVVEGIEFQRLGPPIPKKTPEYELAPCLISGRGAALHVSNCRFQTSPGMLQICVYTEGTNGSLRVQNCLFLCPDSIAVSGGTMVQRRTVTNCAVVGGWAQGVHRWHDDIRDGEEIQLSNNTIVATEAAARFYTNIAKDDDRAAVAKRPIKLDAACNIFDVPATLLVGGVVRPVNALHAEQFFEWQDHDNLFRPGGSALLGTVPEQSEAERPKSLADWKAYWAEPEASISEGAIRYQGGDLVSRMHTAPEKLSADDFRLRADSAGYRAGKDGKDPGADVDLVGPGLAYDRWKSMPEYQEWLKASGQVTRVEVPQEEPKAFVVLTGEGVEVNKFDTLAEAVHGSSDGDTIEIRGNGPFLTPPLKITNSHVIRAAAGFRPVIEPAATGSSISFIEAEAPLALEGIEFRWLDERTEPQGGWTVVLSAAKDLHAANCRFVTRRVTAHVVGHQGPYALELRNCEFLASHGYIEPNGAFQSTQAVFPQVQRKTDLDNCILTCRLFMSRRWGYANGAALRLKRCTLRSPDDAFRFVVLPKLSGEEAFASEDWTSKAVQVDASDNVIASDGVFAFSQQEVKALLPPGEAENLLVRMVGWRGERNAYACERTLLRLKRHRPEAKLPPPLIADGLAGWKQLWGIAEEGSLEGPVRFVGGDVLAKADAALDQLTPGDFRLRADSAGYRAGPDGKDLGADVDLVGPGEAYERWKKTPEYSEWLTHLEQQR